MDIDSQVEEFDSSSSDSSSSSEDEREPQCEEEEMSESQEEEVVPEDGSDQGFTVGGLSSVEGVHGWVGGRGERKRKRYRKRNTAGLRKKLRTHYESVEDFNPEARSAQSAELERIRRLDLQRGGITSPTLLPPPHTTHSHILSAQQSTSYTVTATSSEDAPQLTSSVEGVPCEGGEGVKREGGDSPELVMVDLTHLTQAVKSDAKTAPPSDTIVIDSGSDSDSNIEKGLPHSASAETQSVAKVKGAAHLPQSGRPEALHRKYDDPTVPRPDGKLIVNTDHGPSETDVFLAPQLARLIKPHQVL